MIMWDDLFKIKISNPDDSMQKHEVVKLLLVMKLINKYGRYKDRIRIYTEFNLLNNRKADVYYENLKTKEAYVYEIQNNYTDRWVRELNKSYFNVSILLIDHFEVIPINLNQLSNNIIELNKQLDKYIF